MGNHGGLLIRLGLSNRVYMCSHGFGAKYTLRNNCLLLLDVIVDTSCDYLCITELIGWRVFCSVSIDLVYS